MEIAIIAIIVVLLTVIFFWQSFHFYFFLRISRALRVSERAENPEDLSAMLKDIYMRRMEQGLDRKQGIFSAGSTKKARLKTQIERWENDPERINLVNSGQRRTLSRLEDIFDGLSSL